MPAEGEVQNLFDLLDQVVRNDDSTGIVSYPLHDTDHPRNLSYAELETLSTRRACALQQQHGFKTGGVILLHLRDHLDNVVWFWSVLMAGCVPALSSPLPIDSDQRRLHLAHLYQLFDDPMCLLRQTDFPDFTGYSDMSLLAVEHLEAAESSVGTIDLLQQRTAAKPDDLTALMLTSGSTGNAKAVMLSHRQILASLAGKDSVTCLTTGTSLLNWIGMDHVAALTETHLLAMYRGLDQIHIQPSDVVADPLLLLRMITKHRVARTVAPNFLLAGLLKSIEDADKLSLNDINLTSLTQLVSGGEANPLQLCVELDQALRRLHAPSSVLQPAFGMTETCAGCTYNLECPARDVHSGMKFASLGKPVGGFEVRVAGSEDEDDRGTLQIRGPQVFSRYYNDHKATASAFTSDGWFDTGDQAFVDDSGNVHLIGRIKDHIRINGVTIVASDLESQLSALSLPGAVNDLYACFGFRPSPTDDEKLAVVYATTYANDDIRQRRATHEAIVTTTLRSHGISPYVVPVDKSEIQRSTLGKLPRAKLRQALQQGKLKSHVLANASDADHAEIEPRNECEAQLLGIFRETFGETIASSIGVRTPWYSLGITSIDLIRLRRKIELGLQLDLPLVKLLQCSTIEKLGVELQPRRRRDSVTEPDSGDEGSAAVTYDPVVELRAQGSKTPLWLFHPGVGEILVFIQLARRIHDRSVYGLRARGFNLGESFFESVDEAVQTYYRAIKKQQPRGPYALAGYSYGAMLAFETAKMLQGDGQGERVEFLASFNLPPHIKFRMQQLDWKSCALHLSHFLGLLHDPEAKEDSPGTGSKRRASIVQAVFDAAPPDRLQELELTSEDFAQWADLAHSMQSMARDYEPVGAVSTMDVFYCQPLAIVAQSKREWLDNHLCRWQEVASDVRFHEVGGEHYTMLDEEHVDGFARTFSAALAARGM